MTENIDKQIEDFQTKTELKQLRFDLKTQRQLNKFLNEKIEDLKSKSGSGVEKNRLEKLNFGKTFTFNGTNKEFKESFDKLEKIINSYMSQNRQQNSSK